MPGLIERAARDWAVDLETSYVIGDSDRDVEAGKRCGCYSILIGSASSGGADATAADLGGAAELILGREQTQKA